MSNYAKRADLRKDGLQLTISVEYFQLTQECRFGYDKTSNYLETDGNHHFYSVRPIDLETHLKMTIFAGT